MRFKKIFFIIPNLRGFYGWPSYPHPGVGYVSSFLEANGVEYDVMDMNLGYKANYLLNKIRTFKPDLIAVTLYTYKHSLTYKLINRIRSTFDIPVVVGGPHVSLFAAKVFKDNLIDFAVKYEGERALLDLCSGRALDTIPNLIYSNNGILRENKDVGFNKNLDELPFPKYTGFELDRYEAGQIGIVSSRGCPYHCIYCPVMTTMGRNFRPRNPQNILNELTYWYERGYRSFEFVDDAFIQNNDRIYQLCDLIEKEKLKDLTLSCAQGIRANKVSRPLLKRMKETGFACLGFGVESASDRTLKIIKKGQVLRQIDEGVKTACELGYDVRLFFMVGFPGEKIEDLEESFKFALKYPVTAANFYNIIPYPGTELFDYLEQNNLFRVAPDIYLNEVITRTKKPLFETPSIPLAERKKALKKGYRISREVSRRHRIKQYRNLGVFGKALSWFLTRSPIFHRLGKIKQHRMTNRFINKFRKSLSPFSGISSDINT